MKDAHNTRVLVTGATGFLGRALVTRLVECGYRVRVLARPQSNADGLVTLGVDVRRGDVTDPTSFGSAMNGADVVVHLAAGTGGSADDRRTTVEGTRALLALARTHRPSRLIYISSCTVYGVAGYDEHAIVAEDAALERHPERRGHYTAAKLEAEQLVTAQMTSTETSMVVLRPGTIYGPGGDLFPPIVGMSKGPFYVVLGTGDFVLPFVYLDNVVEAVLRAIVHPDAPGGVFNVVDPEPLTKRVYMNAVIRRVTPRAAVVYLPLVVVRSLAAVLEAVFGVLGRRAPITRYRLASSQRPVVYGGRRITSRLGWRPVVALTEALDRVVAFERQNGHVAPRGTQRVAAGSRPRSMG